MQMEYLVSVRALFDEIGGSLDLTGSVDVPVLEVGDEVFTPVRPASFSTTIVNAGDGMVATGTVSMVATTTCVRCLCSFETEITGEIEGFWVEHDQDRGDEDDTGVVDQDGAIDLWPILLAALVIEAPFAPLHDEECAGLCTQCGADLNSENCACEQKTDDEHPFAALKAVLVEQETGSEPDIFDGKE